MVSLPGGLGHSPNWRAPPFQGGGTVASTGPYPFASKLTAEINIAAAENAGSYLPAMAM